jgi:hypothetical protein
LKAISLHGPWATWVKLNLKGIETRMHKRFKGLKGQTIAIHAAKKVDWEEMRTNSFFQEKISGGWEEIDIAGMIERDKGNLVCIAKVIDTRWAPNVNFKEREDWNKKAMCETGGKFCLFLDEIKPLKNRIRFTGRQGIFNVPDELISEQL